MKTQNLTRIPTLTFALLVLASIESCSKPETVTQDVRRSRIATSTGDCGEPGSEWAVRAREHERTRAEATKMDAKFHAQIADAGVSPDLSPEGSSERDSQNAQLEQACSKLGGKLEFWGGIIVRTHCFPPLLDSELECSDDVFCTGYCEATGNTNQLTEGAFGKGRCSSKWIPNCVWGLACGRLKQYACGD